MAVVRIRKTKTLNDDNRRNLRQLLIIAVFEINPGDHELRGCSETKFGLIYLLFGYIRTLFFPPSFDSVLKKLKSDIVLIKWSSNPSLSQLNSSINRITNRNV